MAEKTFSGAPFGTQTARFDVTGVHPNKKIPGTFTQIPYDKPSTMELQSITLHTNPSEKWNKCDHSVETREISLSNYQEWYQEKLFKRFKIVTKYQTKNEESSTLVENAIEPPIHYIDRGKILTKLLNMDIMQHSNLSNNNSAIEPNDPISEEQEQNFEDNPIDQMLPVIPAIDIEAASEVASGSRSMEYVEVSHIPLIPQVDKQESSSTGQRKSFSVNKKIEDKEDKAGKTLAFLSQTPARAISYESSREMIKSLIAFHTSVRKASLAQPKKPVIRINQKVQSPARTTLTSLTPVKMKSKSSVVVFASENGLTEKKSNSFKKNIDSEGRPSLKERMRKSQAEGCDAFLRRKLGPGAYNTNIGGFSLKAVESKASGPGWARQLEVERLASLPHLLYKEQWEENKMLKRKLGPGSYDIKDFIQVANEKPRSGRGICDKLAPRFEKGNLSATPGPGTYGIGGVPQRAIEDKDTQSTSTKGMLDKGDRKRTLPSVGSHLGPGTYRHKTCTDELLNKVTSLKGPYKLYSGDRNKPISEGYLAAPQLADLGPGQYEIGSFVDELHNKERRTHGKFGKMAQYPEVPTDRLFLFSQAHCNKKGVPGPGAYSMQELSKPTAVNSPGFLSSAKRDDKISQKFFTRNFNPVGAGRYDIQKFEEAQDCNCHCSVFKSKTGKPTLQMAKFLQERIRAKDVSVENRVVLCQPTKMTRSLTVM